MLEQWPQVYGGDPVSSFVYGFVLKIRRASIVNAVVIPIKIAFTRNARPIDGWAKINNRFKFHLIFNHRKYWGCGMVRNGFEPLA